MCDLTQSNKVCKNVTFFENFKFCFLTIITNTALLCFVGSTISILNGSFAAFVIMVSIAEFGAPLQQKFEVKKAFIDHNTMTLHSSK